MLIVYPVLQENTLKEINAIPVFLPVLSAKIRMNVLFAMLDIGLII